MAYTPIDIGNVNTGTRGVPTEMDNALKIYGGLVLTAFDRRNIALGMVKTKTISNGSSVQFPVIAQASDADVKTHTPGSELLVNQIAVKERVINVDALAYYSMAINKFEEKILHFSTRAELAKQAGEALATKIDKAVFSKVAEAACTSGTIGGSVMQPDGTAKGITLTGTAEAKGDLILGAIYDVVATLRGKDVTGDLTFITTPTNYNFLVQSSKAIHRDYTSGNGDIASGNIIEIAGVKIGWSNNLPSTYDIDGAGAGTAKTVHGLLFNENCVGVVKLMDITSESNYLPKELSTLLTSYYAYGMGVLNPSCAAIIHEA